MRSRIVSAAIALAVLAGGVAAFAATGSGGETYAVTADVEQAPNLFEGGRVSVRGIEVGEITDVEPRPEGVRLTMEIQADVKVPADATLAVIPVTVISDRYVQLFPAYEGGPVLEDGDHLGTDRTSIPAELEEVLTQLQGLLEALEPGPNQERGSLARLVESLDAVFANRSEELAGTIEGSAEVLDNLSKSRGDIVSLIRNLDRLFSSLANRSSQIGIVNERLELVMESLLADQEHLEGTIENIRFLAGETADLLDASGDELGASLGRLARVLGVLLEHQDSLAAGVQWANVIAQTAGATDTSGKGLFAYSGRQAPPGTEGAEYNYRLDTRDVISCERIQQVANSVLVLLPAGTEEDVLSTLLSFIPDAYDDHIRFLLLQLIPYCVDQLKPAGFDPATREAILDLSEQVGEEEVIELLGRWLIEGMVETP